MWQRFTERARRAVFFAQEEAARFGQSNVGPEHLVLGLVRDSDSVAARILNRMGVSLGRIRSEIERQVTQGNGKISKDRQLTAAGHQMVSLAYDEARQLSNNYIGTEHLLLGAVRLGEENDKEFIGHVLMKLGVELERTRREVMALQDNDSGIAPVSYARQPRFATGAARMFAREFQNLPADKQTAMQSGGLPLSQLPVSTRMLLNVLMETPEKEGKLIVPDPDGLVRVTQEQTEGGDAYIATTSVSLIANVLIRDGE